MYEPSMLTFASQGPKPKKPKSTAKVIRNANITKPQTLFQLAPHNFPDGPWKPILTKKPHATLSLKKSLTTIKGEDGSSQYDQTVPGFGAVAN